MYAMFYVYVLLQCLLFFAENPELQQSKYETPLNTFSIEGHNIIPVFDYVHLQKGIRNNLLNKDLSFINKQNKKDYASWAAITTTYEIDKYTRRNGKKRLLDKLHDKHIYSTLIPKMKVKYAVEVLSHTVASVLEFCSLLEHGKQ